MYREAAYLVEQGVADVETVDRSFRNACGLWATMCGPFQWIDLTGGPALYAKGMQRVLPTLSNATDLPQLFADLADADAQGVANGEGFYRWTESGASEAETLFRQHAWNVRQLLNEYFPIPESACDAPD
jgi:3-hydroxybutyryl-CoA dehydrogenase